MVCFLVVDFLLVSVLPFLSALNITFVKIFLWDIKQPYLLQTTDVNKSEQVEEYEHSIDPEHIPSSNRSSSNIKMRPQFKNDDQSHLERKLIQFNFLEVQLQVDWNRQRQNGLGKILLGTSGNLGQGSQLFTFREINFKQLSTYVLEEVETEIKRINDLQNDYVSHIHGFYSGNNKIVFASKYYSNGSLYDLIFLRKGTQQDSITNEVAKNSAKPEKQIKYETKVSWAIQLARGIQYLHSQQFPHGHLHPHNIMLNKNFIVKIVDLGFVPLKKYCSIIFGYTNKSQYVAPEILIEKGNVVTQPTSAGDIYSMGMILYEIFSEKIPFKVRFFILFYMQKDVPLKDVQRIVVEQHGRPKIEIQQVGEDMATLIRWCWQQDATKRPPIDQIVKALENLKESVEQK